MIRIGCNVGIRVSHVNRGLHANFSSKKIFILEYLHSYCIRLQWSNENCGKYFPMNATGHMTVKLTLIFFDILGVICRFSIIISFKDWSTFFCSGFSKINTQPVSFLFFKCKQTKCTSILTCLGDTWGIDHLRFFAEENWHVKVQYALLQGRSSF